MSSNPSVDIRRLTADDAGIMRQLITMMGDVFDEPGHYHQAQPDDVYLRTLLARDSFIAIAALAGDDVIGGITAYVLPKYEQPRCEVFIYDLAVVETHRRQGVATALINEVRRIADEVGAWVVIIEADHGEPAPDALYSKLGTREEILHFNMSPLTGAAKGHAE